MFNINGATWRVFLTSPNHPMLMRSDGSFTIGACDNDTRSIYINENLEPERMKKVLCHEIAHASMFSYGVDLDIYQEELLADLMATYGPEIIRTTHRIINENRESYFKE